MRKQLLVSALLGSSLFLAACSSQQAEVTPPADEAAPTETTEGTTDEGAAMPADTTVEVDAEAAAQ